MVTVTDDDVIEKSNLSRQFLFRNWHIGSAKSTVASEAAQKLNPGIHINALQVRPGGGGLGGGGRLWGARGR